MKIQTSVQCGTITYKGACDSTEFTVSDSGFAWCSKCGSKVAYVKETKIEEIEIQHDWTDDGDDVKPFYCSVCGTLWDHVTDKQTCFKKVITPK